MPVLTDTSLTPLEQSVLLSVERAIRDAYGEAENLIRHNNVWMYIGGYAGVIWTGHLIKVQWNFQPERIFEWRHLADEIQKDIDWGRVRSNTSVHEQIAKQTYEWVLENSPEIPF